MLHTVELHWGRVWVVWGLLLWTGLIRERGLRRSTVVDLGLALKGKAKKRRQGRSLPP